MNPSADAQLASAEQMLTLSFLILAAVAILIFRSLRDASVHRRRMSLEQHERGSLAQAVDAAQPQPPAGPALPLPVDAPAVSASHP